MLWSQRSIEFTLVSLLSQVPVVLRFTCANLQKSPSIVYVSGSMTDWKSVEMARCKGEKDFNLILDCSPGKYFYKFFVNNEWCVDESQTISSYMTRKPSGTKGTVIYRCERMLWYTSNTDFGFHQFEREPRIVQKQTIPHLKGLIVGFLNPEDWGRGILIGLPRPLFMIN